MRWTVDASYDLRIDKEEKNTSHLVTPNYCTHGSAPCCCVSWYTRQPGSRGGLVVQSNCSSNTNEFARKEKLAKRLDTRSNLSLPEENGVLRNATYQVQVR